MDPLIGYAVTAALSLTVGILLKYIEPKGKVYFWWPHTFRFKPKPELEIQTDALTIQNFGRAPVEDVEIVMQCRPDCFEFSPSVPYDEVTSTNGTFIFRVRSLAPKEFFTLQILSYTRLPNVVNIRSKAGSAERLPFRFQRVFPRWVNLIVAYLMFSGLGLTIYLIFKLVHEIYTRIQ